MTEVLDVLQIGYGPVGQALAAHLGSHGHSVRVIERHTSLYEVSRAGTLDAEAMRILQSVGVAEALEPAVARNIAMALVDRDKQVLAEMDLPRGSVSGWHASYTMYQPDLEQALDARVRSLSSVDVARGWEVTDLVQAADRVVVTSRHRQTGESRTDQARFVVGCDGANSAVRELAGLDCADLGYRGPWLVCDFEHHDPDVKLPFTAGFVLDPQRPRMFGRWLGRRHSRFEFMVMPGEDPADFDNPEACWALVREWGVTPETSTLVRHAVYTFGSLLAQQWRSGRVLLAGDAAHVMPPFLGQGLCSGLRDAANLAWKLDLVLRGAAGDALLDTYTAERREHVEQIIVAAMGMGAMISLTDPEHATGRDSYLRSQGGAPPSPTPTLTGGVLHRAPDGTLPPGVGALALQAVVESDGRRARLDDIAGTGWRILTRRAPGPGALSAAQEALLKQLDAGIILISPARVDGAVLDVDLDYEAWFDSLHADTVVVRPDFHTFAVLADVDGLGEALDDLAARLGVLPR